ncbi:hypothetical protein CKO32_04465 [Afifella marina DSM 2698]|nr:hypothetical protein [Afifella marina DSM 2698]MBK1625811.1 hypothetical protein [Afifella marina]MBK5917633.1 hypothetical protein [Afifella marina]RAI23558.1 hypothetical protein CH311_01380 [Afifella marina DSM 2698]
MTTRRSKGRRDFFAVRFRSRCIPRSGFIFLRLDAPGTRIGTLGFCGFSVSGRIRKARAVTTSLHVQRQKPAPQGC